ncbi:TRAP transporter large permease [Oceanobacillus sojae]|uniref:TRAP transporter large permease n=1 Tax=Oceanobacillus sojae TaxID=582851 RepID=UPI0021A31719|nr:TRAP transporter large permease [Oceanobacillus sojae]MCT1901868.1 TRAP transporter large permease [Oceanobacillus sojae]
MQLFGLFLLLILYGIPVAFGFVIAGIIYVYFVGDVSFSEIITVSYGGLDSFVLLSVPLFIFAGDLMKYGGITSKLIDFGSLFFKRGGSGLGGITVLSSTFFGAITGSSAASVATIGSIMVPEMEKQGFSKPYAASLASASGFIGILIPPSIPLIIYGLSAGASISDLFIAGIVPGVLVAVAFIVLNIFLTKRYASQTGTPKQNKQPVWKVFIRALPGLILPVIILGGIYSGIFTPTESAGVAVIYAIVIGLFVTKSYKINELPKIALESAITSGSVLVIIGFATFFGRLLTINQIPATISEFLTGITESSFVLLIIINIIFLLFGMFLETSTAIMILTPILLPVATQIGVDPIHFGVIMVLNLGIGLITPPMALNLFVASQVSNVPFKQLVRPSLPFLYVSVILLIMLTFIPEIALILL